MIYFAKCYKTKFSEIQDLLVRRFSHFNRTWEHYKVVASPNMSHIFSAFIISYYQTTLCVNIPGTKRLLWVRGGLVVPKEEKKIKTA